MCSYDMMRELDGQIVAARMDESVYALERELQQRLFEGADAAEGLAACNGKRPPQFKGS